MIPFILRNRNRKRICTLHGSPARSIVVRRGKALASAYGLVERIALRRTTRVLAVDTQTASEYAARYPWLQGRLTTVPNGVDTSLFRPLNKDSEKQKWGFSGPVFLYAGRLEPEKRVVEIVEAFRSPGDAGALLAIAGAGSERAAIQAKAKGLPVRFLGVVPRNEMPSLLNAADAAVLFSCREGLPSIALEALACRVPVIATPQGDLPKLIRQGETGFLVSNVNELKAAMKAIVRGRLQPGFPIEETAKRYDWTEIGLTMLSIYKEVWNGHPAQAGDP